MKKNVCYVTGNRADFGLMVSTLHRINCHPGFHLTVAITGMHLDSNYGGTQREVLEAGFDSYIVPNSLDNGSRQSMGETVGEQLVGFTKLFSSVEFTIIIVLGDRGEMLAASLAALYLNIPVVHIHGGELSGTVDESIRHAISKLSHFHFTSTKGSKERLIKLGEREQNIYVTGAPGLDDIVNVELPDKQAFVDSLDLNVSKRILTVIFHPVVQDAEFAGYYMANVLKGLPENEQIVILMPNSDAGNTKIREEISSYSSLRSNVNVFTHLSRETYLALLAYSDLLIGNSSSGIIEAASFSTRVINIGQRQNKRERNSNTIDVNVDPLEIKNAISESLTLPSFRPKNLYGDGKSGERIVNILSALEIDENTTKKCNTY